MERSREFFPNVAILEGNLVGKEKNYTIEIGDLDPEDVHLVMNGDGEYVDSITIKAIGRNKGTIRKHISTELSLDGLVALSDIKCSVNERKLVIETKITPNLDQIWDFPWMDKVPILNIMKDACEGVPNADHIKETVDTAALISALLLTIASTLPFSMSYEDYQ